MAIIEAEMPKFPCLLYTLALAWAIIILHSSSAAAQFERRINQTVQTSSKRVLATMFCSTPNCSVAPCKIDITTKPRLGRLSVSSTMVTVPAVSDSGPGNCAGRRMKGLRVIYHAHGGRGTDQFSMQLNNPARGTTSRYFFTMQVQ
jgi:hypothetical protein